MSKWIVFITVVHEELTFSADLRSEGERSVATYPLLAAPTNAIAELVVARLNHQHGLPEEAGADDWQEFSFKAETELTPQEVAMALDLNDPAYPKNGRHPSWLSGMVTAAKTAMADVVKHRASSPKHDDPAYLFVGTGATATPSTVFHRAGTAGAAATLRGLFAKEYSANGSPAFNFQAAGALPPDERLLLDEAIDELAIYDDPDPGVYDPPASKALLARAEYARRADRWEAMLLNKASAATGVASVTDRVNDLLRAVERHRLMFLYWAAACRRNPLAVRSRTGINERVSRDDVRGWKEMVEAIDAEGAFLWTHRSVLDRYAQEAIGMFGPGEGSRPGEPDESGRSVPVDGGTYPYWSIDEGSTSYLEESSDAILEACRSLAEAGQHEVVFALVKDASAAARPEHHDRWYANVVVKWSYLSALDSLISRIKAVRVELALPPRSEKAGPSKPEVVKPDPQSVADVVVLFMVTRDLVRIGRDYPDAMPQADHKAWVDEVTAHANLILKRPGFEGIKKLMKEPTLLEMNVPERFGMLMSAAMMAHPAMAAPAGTPAEIQAAVEKAMSACQETASPHIKEQMSRLANLMVVSCRCPTGTAVKDFADPARFLQMLHRYWMLASAMVQAQATVHVGFNPHPLLHLIENVRDRLSTCFSRVVHLDGAGEAQQACDQLVGMLTEGDIDDLSAVPEWTNGELQRVERFIARARLKTGPRVFELTAAEEFFIKQSEHLIAEHEKRCRAAWKQMLARADAQAAARRPADSSPTTPPGSGAAAQPAGTPEQRIERIGPLLSSLVAADNGIMSLGARLRSLSTRGTAANTHALTVKVQEQLHKWIDPIVQHLKDAETASSGVGPHLVGLIAEPVAWEVDTRLAIRTLKDQLVGLIYSNGGENEESFVVGAASSLCDRGQRLQAAFEALNAQAVPHQPHASSNGTKPAPNVQPTPMVVLGRAGDPCTVKGKPKKALTDGQHAVVAALIEAGDEGLTKDAIEAVRSSARRMLDDLRKDSDWAGVIIMPGQTNGRYRVRT
jgi:hypothetical protein